MMNWLIRRHDADPLRMKTATLWMTWFSAAACLGIACALAPIGRAAEEATDSAVAAPAAGAAGDAQTGPRIEGSQINGRWREGSRLVDQLGHFKSVGDRVTFVSTDGKLHFDCLENLGSERIGRTISDNPDQLEWSVCGVLTECHGTNYLLVTQAMLKTKAARTRR